MVSAASPRWRGFRPRRSTSIRCSRPTIEAGTPLYTLSASARSPFRSAFTTAEVDMEPSSRIWNTIRPTARGEASPSDYDRFVPGFSRAPVDLMYGYVTIAYDALTGQQLWETRKQWDGSNFDSPTAMTIDPASNSLLITGQTGRGSATRLVEPSDAGILSCKQQPERRNADDAHVLKLRPQQLDAQTVGDRVPGAGETPDGDRSRQPHERAGSDGPSSSAGGATD